MGHLLLVLIVFDNLELEGFHCGVVINSHILIDVCLSELSFLDPHLSLFSWVRAVKFA